MKYKKILVCYDGSEKAERALKHGSYLARSLNSQLFVLNVISIPHKPYGIEPSEEAKESIKEHLESIMEKLEEDMRQLLEYKCKELNKEGINVACFVERGVPVEVIPEFVKNNKIDLVVMGSKPAPRAVRINVLGSVSRYVLEHVKCPVLIVH
ncbi:MAG: universal stress protein [Candidatus Nitrosothermus koennekii]|nr:MAG: universal stress protein [Candidatus Nitrosothermus koennekii]